MQAQLAQVDHPGGADETFAELSTKIGAFAGAFHRLARASDAVQYNALINRLDIGSRGHAVDRAYSKLVDELAN